MKRKPTSPRVREIMTALDEAIALQAEELKRTGRTETYEGIVDCMVHHSVIGQHTYDDWPADSLRAIVEAFAVHAPPDVFKAMLDRVRKDRQSNVEIRTDYEREDWPAAEAVH